MEHRTQRRRDKLVRIISRVIACISTIAERKEIPRPTDTFVDKSSNIVEGMGHDLSLLLCREKERVGVRATIAIDQARSFTRGRAPDSGSAFFANVSSERSKAVTCRNNTCRNAYPRLSITLRGTQQPGPVPRCKAAKPTHTVAPVLLSSSFKTSIYHSRQRWNSRRYETRFTGSVQSPGEHAQRRSFWKLVSLVSQ